MVPAGPGKSPNWLLIGFFFVSAAGHVLILLLLAGIYEKRPGSCIELALIRTESTRKLPTPRVRKKPPQITTAGPQALSPHRPPAAVVPPERPEIPRPALGPGLMPSLSAKLDIPGLAFPGLPRGAPPPLDPGSLSESRIEFTSARDYLDMLNLKIHNAQKYPEGAKDRHLEGRVEVRFVLKSDGSLSQIKVIRSSRHKKLDEAAMEAVKAASPFPRPPASFFTPPVTLQISILFELA